MASRCFHCGLARDSGLGGPHEPGDALAPDVPPGVGELDLEVVLPADEREAVAELEQQRRQPSQQRVLQVALGGRAGEVQDVGIAGELLGELAGRTLRDQPARTAAAAYQSRCAWSVSSSSRTVVWPPGSCATACCAVGAGNAAAKVRT